MLHVAGGADEKLPVRRTIWGPIVGRGADGRELALSWTADRPEATDMAMLGLERAKNIDEAAASIGGAGMPAQNVMIGDSGGRIGWVLSGRLPRRHGFDPRRPADWSGKDTGWDGWLAAAESPRILDPPDGRTWSANARVVGGEMLAKIGDGGYAPATRARQIRDRLEGIQSATAKDLLAIQLDDRACTWLTGSRYCCTRSRRLARPRPRDWSRAGPAMPRSTIRVTGCCANSRKRPPTVPTKC